MGERKFFLTEQGNARNNKANAAILGRLPTVQKSTRRLYPQVNVFDVYIVTQTRTKPLLDSETDDPTTENTPIWRDIDEDFFDTATDFTLRAKTIKAKRAERDESTGKWSIAADVEEEDIAIDALHGVIFTGDTMFVSSIGGVKNWVNGYTTVYFNGCSANEDMPPSTKKTVSLSSFGVYRVQAKNEIGVDTIFANESVTLIFNDHDQSFDVLKVACPS